MLGLSWSHLWSKKLVASGRPIHTYGGPFVDFLSVEHYVRRFSASCQEGEGETFSFCEGIEAKPFQKLL